MGYGHNSLYAGQNRRYLGLERIAPFFEMPADWPEEIRKNYLSMALHL